jgi:hypothetical protein
MWILTLKSQSLMEKLHLYGCNRRFKILSVWNQECSKAPIYRGGSSINHFACRNNFELDLNLKGA